MNILRREQRAGRKAFIIWMAVMFFLCFAGIVKFQSYTASGSMAELLASFPRIVMAVMGAAGLDIGTLSGYTALLFYYVLICAVIYAVHLGSSAVARESIDKTYEFVFTKPCSRGRVLGLKLASAYIYLFLFCAFNAVFSMLAVAYLKTSEDVGSLVLLFALDSFLIGSLFVALSALFASIVKQPEKGAFFGNLAFLYAFIIGVVYNMLDNPGLLKLAAPFNYFSPQDLIAGRFDPVYAVITLLLIAASLYGTFASFGRKDLT